MHKRLACLVVLLFSFIGSAGAVTIDFEEYSEGVINPPSGDSTSKGFLLDYLDTGSAGNPVIFNQSGNNIYINCPTCLPVEQIDLSRTTGQTFSIFSIDVGISGGLVEFDFIFTGFVNGGGVVTQSVLGVTTPNSLQTVNFGAGWSDLTSFRIEIDNSGNTPLTGASAIDNIVVTPIPAAVWLFGSALLGLIGIKRRAI